MIGGSNWLCVCERERDTDRQLEKKREKLTKSQNEITQKSDKGSGEKKRDKSTKRERRQYRQIPKEKYI